jgi:uncharacterized repeat protein (TIGR01451 family)
VAKTRAKTQNVLSLLMALMLATTLLVAGSAQAQTDPGLGITQTANPDPATVGQPLTFAVTLTNNSDPQHVGLKDFFPQGWELVSATPSQGTCDPGHHSNAVQCNLGKLPRGGSATVEVVVVPTAPGPATNTAQGGGELSPVNSDEATVTVNPAAEKASVGEGYHEAHGAERA